MKELEEFFKNVKRIADALENISNAQNKPIKTDDKENEKQTVAEHVLAPDAKAGTINISTVPVPLGQIPVSNTVQTYTRDQIAVAMGHALDDPAKMQQITTILNEFGATSLMDIPEDQYSNLVLRLKTIGVEV